MDKQSEKTGMPTVRIVDNKSIWGTYVVTERGAVKVPEKLSSSIYLHPGNLICIGVMPNGPARLDTVKVSVSYATTNLNLIFTYLNTQYIPILFLSSYSIFSDK